MRNFNIIDKQGIKLNTANTYVNDDINIGLREVDKSNLVAENIKKDVNILGVVGTHEGGASLNVAYGTTPPEDTSKIWLECEEPEAVEIANYMGEVSIGEVANYGAISNPVDGLSDFYVGYYNTCYIGNNQIAIVGYNHIRIYDLTSKSYIADYTISVGTNSYYTNVLYKDNILYFAYGSKLYNFNLSTQTLTNLGYYYSSHTISYIFFSSENEIDYLGYYYGYSWHIRYNLINSYFTLIKQDTTNIYPSYAKNHTIKVNNTVYNFYMYATTATNPRTWKYDLSTNSFTTFTSFYDFMTELGWTYYFYSSTIYDNERYIYLIGGQGTYNGTSAKSDLIIKYDTINDTFEVLDQKLIGEKYLHFSVLVDDRVYIFGGASNDTRKNYIDYFDISYPLTENNVILTINNKTDNYLPLINTDKLKLNSNIASAYKGNSDNLAEKVNVYYHNGYGWVGINCEDYAYYFTWDKLPTLTCALHGNVAIDLSQYYHTNGEVTLAAVPAGGGMAANINGTVLDITNNSATYATTVVITATVNNTEYQTTLTVDVPATTSEENIIN